MKYSTSEPFFKFDYRDLSAGLVVFLVALPLCLGIALASHAPLISGVISGLVGGIIVSMISGSPLSVSGPAAGLAVIVASNITELGSYEKFLPVIILAGIIQILFGSFRLGGFADYVPNSVIRGMLAGIGVIIIIKQFSHAIGYYPGVDVDASFLQQGDSKEGHFVHFLSSFSNISPTAVIISLFGVSFLIFWESLKNKNIKIAKNIPGPLIVVLLGTLFNQWILKFIPELGLSSASGELVSLPGINNIVSAIPMPDFGELTNIRTFKYAIVLAIVASIETLLSLEATDKLDPQKRISPPNKELVAQGVGNVLCGFFGGLPMTAVIVRSSANVYAGGRTRWSSFFHGVLLLISVVTISHFLNKIPLATLAAILIVTGLKLASFKTLTKTYQEGWSQFLPFIVTLLTIVFVDLLSGVVVGILVGLLFVILANHHEAMTVVSDDDTQMIRFNKDISFMHKSLLKRLFSNVSSSSKTILIDGSHALFIDHDIVEVIEDFKSASKGKGINVITKQIKLR